MKTCICTFIFLGDQTQCNDDILEIVQPNQSTRQACNQPTLLSFGQSGKRITQSELDNAIVDYISDSVLPFNHVSQQPFHNFVLKLLPYFESSKLKIKHRTTYQSQLASKYNTLTEDLIRKLSQVKHVCLTADHWAARSKGYLGLTAHWFEGHTRKQAALTLKRITDRCTYDVLADAIMSVILEFGLDGKVTHCVTDSGSNFVKAFKVIFVSMEIILRDFLKNLSELFFYLGISV